MKQPSIRIAIISNFTTKGLEKSIQNECHAMSISPMFFERNYGQIFTEMTNPKSTLKAFNPDISFLLVSNDVISNDLETTVLRSKKERETYHSKISDQWIDLLKRFVQNIPGMIVISNGKELTFSPFGIHEDKTNCSTQDMIKEINTRLKETFIHNNRIRIYDMNSFFLRFGERNIIDEKLRLLGDIYISPPYIPVLAHDLMAYITPFASKQKKAIVLDLDNTLWGGVVGEDGIHHLALDDKAPGNAYKEFQRYLLSLHKRGIILAINSKNNLKDAIEVIASHPHMLLREKHFASIKINWDDKAKNLEEIAKELNIGLDALVFFDDNPVNQELVRSLHPEVLVVNVPKDPSLYTRTLKDLVEINTLQITDEDFAKGTIYYQQRKRSESRGKARSMDDFLETLAIQVDIKPANTFTIPRIAQLTKKTNQFNLTTKRYTEDDIKKFVKSNTHAVYSVTVKDKFGDHGLTGVIIVKADSKELYIDTLLLSCRVMGLGIEQSMLYQIFLYAKEKKYTSIIGEYRQTEKNSVVKNFYTDNGFVPIDANYFKRSIIKSVQNPKHIAVSYT